MHPRPHARNIFTNILPYIWSIPRQVDQAEALTFFFMYKYIIDGHKKWPTPIFRLFWKFLWQ